MGQNIRVIHSDGTSFYLNDYNAKSVVTRAEYIDEYLIGDKIEVTVDSSVSLPFRIGDMIMYDVPIKFNQYTTKFEKRNFVLNYMPDVDKNNSRDFEFILTFEGWFLSLKRCIFLKDDAYTNSFFVGNLSTFCQVLNTNINRVFGANSWYCDVQNDDTEERNFAFDNMTCYDVVQELCEAYNYAIHIERDNYNRIHLQFVQPPNDITDVTYLSYGYGNGLTNIKKKTTKQVFSRLYAYGNSENLNSYITDDGFVKGDKVLLPYNENISKSLVPSPLGSGMLRPIISRFVNVDANSPYVNALLNFVNDYENHKQYVDNIAAIRFIDGDLQGEIFLVKGWVNTLISGGYSGALQLYRRMINGVLRPAAQSGGADSDYSYNRYIEVLPACNPNTSYIQDNDIVADIGIRESVKIFDDIKIEACYPMSKMEIIQVAENQNPKFQIHITKSELPFNISQAAADGEKVQITFQSGALSGYSFDVLNDTNYHVTDFTYNGIEYWNIPCLSIQEVVGYTLLSDGNIDFNSPIYRNLPSDDNPQIIAASGDKVLISGIIIPRDMYLKAENELLEKAKEYYQKNAVAKVQYEVNLDPQWLQQYSQRGYKCKISSGYFVSISDNDLHTANNGDKLFIQRVQKSLIQEYTWNIQLSDTSKER